MPLSLAYPSLKSQIDCEGFAIIEEVIPTDLIARFPVDIESPQPDDAVRRRRGKAFAIRNLLDTVPQARAIAESSELRALVDQALDPKAFITRAILFDKNPRANWAVPWHQDTTIAVQERIEQPGFGPWSVKAGVIHVQPPSSVLENMLTARIHLDDCDADNGALLALPRSHADGILDTDQTALLRGDIEPVSCSVRAGGVLFMRPLLLHASLPSKNPSHRRVIHLEFAIDPLPDGLEWFRC